MVEHRLAKARVESSNLFSRSILDSRFKQWVESWCASPIESLYRSIDSKAGWQSGYAADCNSVYAGSIPTPASISHDSVAISSIVDAVIRPDGEIGRRKRLKISRGQPRAGSSPAPGTTFSLVFPIRSRPLCRASLCITPPRNALDPIARRFVLRYFCLTL